MSIKLENGNWGQGFAYDVHVRKSTYLGNNDYGYPMFDNSYSPMGKLVHDLKYGNKVSNAHIIVELLLSEFSGWDYFDYIVPAPFSKNRTNQPVHLISNELSNRVNVPMISILKKDSKVELKNCSSPEEKIKILSDSINIDDNFSISGKRILLIDDLFDSGATLNVSTQVLLDNGAASVCVLAMTKTKG